MNVVTESLLTPEDWVRDAVCATTSPDLFFPDHGDMETVRAAKRICASCPVRTECAEYAIRTNQTYGIWGGMAPKTLRAERRTV